MRRSNSSWREECEATLADLVPCSLEETFSGETKKPRRCEKPRLRPFPHSACASARRGARRRRTCGGKVTTPSTASDGEEAVFAWQGEVQVRAVHSVSSRQGEVRLRGLQPLPHGKHKPYCADCNPCPHGKVKNNCAACNPRMATARPATRARMASKRKLQYGKVKRRRELPRAWQVSCADCNTAREVQIHVHGLQSRSRGSRLQALRPRDQAQA